MEKIIAVVVMIAIVIGLIATAVLPMVGQMNEQGSTAQNQLTQIGQSMGNANMLQGATVKAEINSLKAKFNLPTDKLTSITVTGTDGADKVFNTSASITSTDLAKINDNAMFAKTTTSYDSGALKTVTYTMQKVQ